MAVNLWTSERNKILTYLWYLDVEDMAIVEKFTGIPEVECSLKYSAFPTQLPAILKHASHLNAFPQILLRTSLPENFKILENKICKTGLFTAEKVYEIWLKISKETSRQAQLSRIWGEGQEKIMAYLWYARIKKVSLASKFTGMTMKQCSRKWMQFPGKLPDELVHNYQVNKKSLSTFEDLQTDLTKSGLKTADEVYAVWQNTYRSKPVWSIDEVRMLCKTVFYSKKKDGKIPWIKVADAFTNKTANQCDLVYRRHVKKMRGDFNAGSELNALCQCFLMDEAINRTGNKGSNEFDSISDSPLFEITRDDELDIQTVGFDLFDYNGKGLTDES